MLLSSFLFPWNFDDWKTAFSIEKASSERDLVLLLCIRTPAHAGNSCRLISDRLTRNADKVKRQGTSRQQLYIRTECRVFKNSFEPLIDKSASVEKVI
jgi:hypothetical protein